MIVDDVTYEWSFVDGRASGQRPDYDAAAGWLRGSWPRVRFDPAKKQKRGCEHRAGPVGTTECDVQVTTGAVQAVQAEKYDRLPRT